MRSGLGAFIRFARGLDGKERNGGGPSIIQRKSGHGQNGMTGTSWIALRLPPVCSTLDGVWCRECGLVRTTEIQPQRLFTVEHHIILHSIGKVQAAKLDEVLRRVRGLFVD